MRKILFNIFCLGWVIFFIYLGAWQVERMNWKKGLIKQVEMYKAEDPVQFRIDDFDQKRDLFKKVFLFGKFLHENEILLSAKYFSATQDKNELGYHVITPFITTDGAIVFVNRGWVPEKYKTRESRPDSLYENNVETTIEGVVRESSGQAPWYMPQNMPEKNVWFWIDIPAMIKSLKDKTELQNIRPVLIQQTNLTTKNDFKYPVPISGDIQFYNQHLTYVITWFSMALMTLVMWGIYIRKNRNKV